MQLLTGVEEGDPDDALSLIGRGSVHARHPGRVESLCQRVVIPLALDWTEPAILERCTECLAVLG